MYTHVCKFCGKEFRHETKKTKFCSRRCYYDSRKGVERPEHGKKIKEIMLSKNETYKGTERARNIGESNKKEGFTAEQEKRIIDGIRKYYYVKNPKILLKKIGLWEELRNGLRKDAIMSLIEKHNTFMRKNEFFSLNVQNKSRREIDGIVEESQLTPWNKLIAKYGISYKEYMHLLRKHDIDEYAFKESDSGKQTKPEKMAQDILRKIGVSYKREKYVGSEKFRYDFIVENRYAIEVQGDYWHGNRRLFEEKDLNNVQIKNIKRDEEKKAYIIDMGYVLIEVWEMDLYRKYTTVFDNLERIIRGGENNGENHFSSEFFQDSIQH